MHWGVLGERVRVLLLCIVAIQQTAHGQAGTNENGSPDYDLVLGDPLYNSQEYANWERSFGGALQIVDGARLDGGFVEGAFSFQVRPRGIGIIEIDGFARLGTDTVPLVTTTRRTRFQRTDEHAWDLSRSPIEQVTIAGAHTSAENDILTTATARRGAFAAVGHRLHAGVSLGRFDLTAFFEAVLRAELVDLPGVGEQVVGDLRGNLGARAAVNLTSFRIALSGWVRLFEAHPFGDSFPGQRRETPPTGGPANLDHGTDGAPVDRHQQTFGDVRWSNENDIVRIAGGRSEIGFRIDVIFPWGDVGPAPIPPSEYVARPHLPPRRDDAPPPTPKVATVSPSAPPPAPLLSPAPSASMELAPLSRHLPVEERSLLHSSTSRSLAPRRPVHRASVVARARPARPVVAVVAPPPAKAPPNGLQPFLDEDLALGREMLEAWNRVDEIVRAPGGEVFRSWQEALRRTVFPQILRMRREAKTLVAEAQAMPEGWERDLRLRAAAGRQLAAEVYLRVLQLGQGAALVGCHADRSLVPSGTIATLIEQMNERFQPLLKEALSFDPRFIRAAVTASKKDFALVAEKLDELPVLVADGAVRAKRVVQVANLVMLAISFGQVIRAPVIAGGGGGAGSAGGASPGPAVRGFAGGTAVAAQASPIAVGEALDRIRKLVAVGALDPRLPGVAGSVAAARPPAVASPPPPARPGILMMEGDGRGAGTTPSAASPKPPGKLVIADRAHPKEVEFARELAAKGHDVVVRGKHASGADFVVDGVKWELKTLNAPTINAVRKNISAALVQSDRVFIDGRSAGLTMKTATEAVRAQVHAGRMTRAAEVRVMTTDGTYEWRR